MKSVWKYPLIINDDIILQMPGDAKPLHVDMQRGSPCLWALVEPDRPMRTYRFRLAGTGHPIGEESMLYVGSFFMHDGDLVFHLFLVEAL